MFANVDEFFVGGEFCDADYPYVFIRWGGRGVRGVVTCAKCNHKTSIYQTGLDCDAFFDAALQSEYGTDGDQLSRGVTVDYLPAKNWLCTMCDGTMPVTNGENNDYFQCTLFSETLKKKRAIHEQGQKTQGKQVMVSFRETLNVESLTCTPQEMVKRSYAKFRHQRMVTGYPSDQTDLYLFDMKKDEFRLLQKDSHIKFAQQLLFYGVWNQYRTIPPSRVIESFTKLQKSELSVMVHGPKEEPARVPVFVQAAHAAYAALYFKRFDDAPTINPLHRVVRGSGRYPIRRRIIAYIVFNQNARNLIRTLLAIPKDRFASLGTYGYSLRFNVAN
jgi:hypothetical protein